jgi:glycosyltransferase involved in cell wall biosynthesis
VLVIIPALKEEAAVAGVVKEVMTAVPEAHILVVDDGSEDDTANVARAAGADVLVLPFNLGVGGALRAGFRYAVRFDYDVAVQVDGDGQHDPTEIERLVAASPTRTSSSVPVRGARRVLRARCQACGHPAAGSLAVPALNADRPHHIRFGLRSAGHQIFARNYPAEYLGDTIEALLIAAKAGCQVSQVPVKMRRRVNGAPSQSALKSTAYLARAALAVFMSRARH